MKRNLLLTVAFCALSSYSQAQWGALARLFTRGAGEAAAARAATRAIEQSAMKRMATYTLEDAVHSGSNLYRTGTNSLDASLDGTIHLKLNNLNPTEEQKLNDYLSKASYFEKVRMNYMSESSLKRLLLTVNDKPKVPVVTTISEYELYSEPALAYSEATVTIQKELRKKGYRVKVDGRFGDETKMAVSKALKKNSLVEFPHEHALEVTKRDLFKNYKSKFIGLHETSFVDRLEFNHNNNLFLSKKINIKDAAERTEIINFYTDFFKNFENKNETFSDARFVTICKTESGTYLGYHYKNAGGEGVSGGLINFDKATEKQKDACVEVLFRDPKVKKVFVYGDDVSDLETMINEKAWQHNATVINRNTTFGKTFDQTQASLKKLANKKITASKLSFLNGTPNSAEEAIFQSFKEEHAGIFQSFNLELNQAVLPKNATLINTKEQLIEELTKGTNDFLFIVAHSDGEKIYFGSSSLSISELQELPVRAGRKTPRTAVLFSCTTGDIYRNMPFENNPKAFAQLLVEKKYFDLVVAPPGTINGGDVLRMTDVLDKHPVLELNKHLSKLLDQGHLINTADIIERLKKSGSKNNIAKNR